jgi:hypothetical protein
LIEGNENSDEAIIAHAQWLAGCALAAARGKSGKVVRLLKKALKVFQKNVRDTDNVFLAAVAQSIIAESHFDKEEYGLAAMWYRSAKSIMISLVGENHGCCKRCTEKLAECEKRD